MSQSPDWLSTIVRETLSAEPTHIQRVGGGMINQAARVVVGQDQYFVKWKTDAPPLFFQAEARGLGALHAAGAIRVPQVVGCGEAAAHWPAYLILEWIETARVDARIFAANFGHALGALHRITSPVYGLDHDNYIGELPQSNTPTGNWIDFYRDRRIGVQMELARKQGLLPARREALLRQVMDRLGDLLDGVTLTPSLLHGDLWSGNFLTAAGNQPVVIDPAVYYGHREVEIAFTELFGGFPPGFLTAYREAYPLDPGYERRRSLYQLYPLLVHLNIFGESYGSSVDAVCRQYVGDLRR
jgi:fructosamine-3-kinase